MKRIFSWILALGMVLGLTACAKGGAEITGTASGTDAQNTGAQMGRWVEEAVVPEGSDGMHFYSAPVQMADGSLCLYGIQNLHEEEQTVCRFTSLDGGKSWKKETLGWEQQAGGSITQVAALADGTVFFTAYTQDDNGEMRYSSWRQKAGSDALTEVPALDGFLCYTLLDAHTVAANVYQPEGDDAESAQKTVLMDLDTGAVTTLENSAADGSLSNAALDASGDAPRLYFIYYGENGPQLMALDEAGSTETLLDALPAGAAACAADADGNFYCAAKGGLYRVAKDGSITEQILADTGFQLGIASNYCNWMLKLENGDFLVSLMDEGSEKNTLYRYHWDETLPAKSENGLTVWSLKDNATVRSAIAAYQKQHPDFTVEYQVALADGDDSTRAADAVQTLNTQLLSGEGPDVLVLDGMDYAAYIRQGFLTDLSGSVDTTALAQNIVSPFVSAEGTYVLPARFSVPVVTGDAGTLGSLTSLDSLQQAILACPARPNQNMSQDSYYNELAPAERYGMGFVSTKQLTEFALESSAPALVKDGSVDEDAVRQLLGFVQAVGGYYNMKDYDAEPLYNDTAMSSDNNDTVLQGDGGYEFCVTKQAKYGWDCLLSAAYFGMMNRDETLGSEAIVRPGLVEGAYLPATLLAVNAAGSQQEAALDFLRVAFGEEVQNSFQTDGSPVLQTALDANIQKAAKYNEDSGYRGDAKAFFAGLKTPVVIDANVEAAVTAHAQTLVDGTETLDQAVTGVKNDLSLYLAEKQ